MLRSLKAKNCFSFLEEVTLDLVVNDKAPHSTKYERSAAEDDRVMKTLAIIGPNASGKTNLLRCLRFVKWFLLDSFALKPEAEFPLRPFLLKKSPHGLAELEVEFEFESRVYRYSVSLTDDAIASEEMQLLDLDQKKDRERRRFSQLFIRTLNKNGDGFDMKCHPDFNIGSGIEEIARKRKNASLLSTALFSNHKESEPIKQYWENVTANIKELDGTVTSPELLIYETAEFYYKHKDVLEKAKAVLEKCDLGLLDLSIERFEVPHSAGAGEKREFYYATGRHRGVDGGVYAFPFQWESGGTQKIFTLLASLIPVLDRGGLAVIDELEADLHPQLLPSIIDLFSSKKTNPKSAQLVFTCHATPLINYLDKYQILIVEKDERGVSQAWRLDEIGGVRNDDNLYTKYMSGAYGGLPEIKLG